MFASLYTFVIIFLAWQPSLHCELGIPNFSFIKTFKLYYSQIVAGITPSPIQLTQYKNRTFVRQRPPRASEHEYLASRMLPLITYMCMHSIIIKNTVRSQHGFPHNPMSPKSSIRKVLIIILVTRRAGPASTTTTNDVLTWTPIAASRALVAFEFGPSLHGNLAAVKLTLILEACLFRLFTSCLSSLAPWEVIKFPESISRQDKVPDWQCQQVDKHPNNIGPGVCGDDNEKAR